MLGAVTNGDGFKGYIIVGDAKDGINLGVATND